MEQALQSDQEAYHVAVDNGNYRGQAMTAHSIGEDWGDPNVVKAAVSANGRCHWFSRALMRGSHIHCGIYVFPAAVLRRLGRHPPSALSEAESLEQLTWIELGYRVIAVEMPELTLAINTPADFNIFRRIVENR